MDKRRIKIATTVLDEVKTKFSETVEFIDDGLEQECWKENISGRGNFSFYRPRSKKLVQQDILYYVVLGFKAETSSLHLTKYVKLYSLGHDIYLRVIWL